MTQVRNYDSLKTKTTQSILPDPESAKQHMRRGNLHCYQYKHWTDCWLMQIDPCISGWTRNTKLVPFWFNGQQFPDGLMKPTKQRAPMMQNPVCKEETPPPPPLPPPQALRPQRFSALVAKYTLQNGK